MAEQNLPVYASATLKPSADHDEAIQALEATTGVLHVEPMFPGEADEELASLVALVLDGDKANQILTRLKRRPYIANAELMAHRRLIA